MMSTPDQFGDDARFPECSLTVGEVRQQLAGRVANPPKSQSVRDILQMAQRLADVISTCQGGQLRMVLGDLHAQRVSDFIDHLPPDPLHPQLIEEMNHIRSRASGLHFSKEMLDRQELRALYVLEALLAEWDRYHGGYAKRLLSVGQCFTVSNHIRSLLGVAAGEHQ